MSAGAEGAATSPFSDLLGPKLIKAGAEVSTVTALTGKKAVGLYFSAHWCGPCRSFTPHLAKAYSLHLLAKGLEVVFVSWDRSQAEFDEYFAEMPWAAVPYAQAEKLKSTVNKKDKVQGIPTLVILDGATGATITKDGREAVINDPRGNELPWKPPTIWDALGSEFLQGTDGETEDLEEVRGRASVIGLYFSAHWCGPCRNFTPMLASAYTEHLKTKGLEVIFVSSDRTQPEFLEYYSEMPWLAIPAGDKRKEQLSKMFDVKGIPTFVLIDAKTGETINGNARAAMMGDSTGEKFPWPKPPVTDMSVEPPSFINEETTLCVMMEGMEEEARKAATAVLEPIAVASKDKGEEIEFAYASKRDRMCDQIRQLTKLGAPTSDPALLLLDIPDEGGYYVSPAKTITTDTITTFLEAYKAGTLERRQLG
jgi:nucleoredoxin